MIIDKLIATNFKKHQSLNVDFTPGKNLITGPNYSGKSTILQALLVGLYGNSMAPGGVPDLIHDDATDFMVEVHLSNGVRIKRTGKNSSVISPSGEVVVRTHTAVNKWCEELLETDRKTFMKVFSSEQGSPQALLAMEGAQLRNFIEQAIGVEELDKLTKQSNAKVTSTEASYNANHELMLGDSDIREYHKKLDEYDKLGKKAMEDVAASEEVLKFLEDRQRGLNQELSDQREAQAALKKYADDKQIWSELLAKLPAITKLVDTEAMSVKLKQDTADYWEVDEQVKAYKSACKNFDDCKDYLESKDKELKVEIPEMVESKPFLEQLRTATENVATVKAVLDPLKTSLETSICPTCKRKLDDCEDPAVLRSKVETKQAELNGFIAVREVALRKFDEITALESVYAKALTKQERANGVIKELENQLAKAAEKKQHAANVVTPEAYGTGAMRQAIDDLSTLLSDAKESNTASRKTEENREKYTAELVKLVAPEPRVFDTEILQSRLHEVGTDLIRHRSTITDGKVCLTGCELNSKSLESLLEKNRAVVKRMVDYKQQHYDYSVIYVALQGARKKAIEDAFSQTMGIATEFVKACTGGDISEVYLAESGIRYVENGRGRGTVSASGAQKTLIGLGMKFGLSQIVQSPFGAVLLDEISADMDEDVSTACLTVLGEYCEQAIIVSHAASDVADNVIEL